MTRQAARTSLQGLLVGDALGAQFFVPANRPHLEARTLPPAPWPWTDDTEMAASIWHVLTTHGTVHQDTLATLFAAHHDFDRGYGPATNRLLRRLREGADWRVLAPSLFGGAGSYGNGAAMRVAPLGAWFAHDPARAATEAALSATITHTHPDAVAGAIAVAVAAATAASTPELSPGAFLDRTLAHVPEGAVRRAIGEARQLLTISDPHLAASVLGNGSRVTAHDTVPFCLWAAARNLDDYEAGFWSTARVGGDADTTCAIVGGIIAARGGVPRPWAGRAEAPPEWTDLG